jgi:hypothetical protein
LRADIDGPNVATRADLIDCGFSPDAIKAQLAARRWQVVGRAVATTNGELTRRQGWAAALINCGPRSVLTAFTAAESFGLLGWERREIHVLVPGGARIRAVDGLPVVVHRVRDWRTVDAHPQGARQRLAPALIAAAGTFAAARSACGLLAAAVQQRLVRTDELRAAVASTPRLRHHRVMVSTVEDIAMGADALSEIDFGQLCRRYRIAAPTRQAVREGPGRRRRYLDAEWIRQDGRRVVAEVDGAVHLQPLTWVDDQLRQNEITLADSLVLRFPAVVVRTAPDVVADQVRRALAG